MSEELQFEKAKRDGLVEVTKQFEEELAAVSAELSESTDHATGVELNRKKVGLEKKIVSHRKLVAEAQHKCVAGERHDARCSYCAAGSEYAPIILRIHGLLGELQEACQDDWEFQDRLGRELGVANVVPSARLIKGDVGTGPDPRIAAWLDHLQKEFPEIVAAEVA